MISTIYNGVIRLLEKPIVGATLEARPHLESVVSCSVHHVDEGTVH
jgi:hypothetical protein